MAEFPALPLFTDAYLADTRHLSTEEHGAYLLLLMCAWRTRGCAVKDDDRFLARIVGVSPHKWRRLKPVMREFFDVSDGVWRQKKLLDVYRGVETRVAKNRANGARGGRAKAAKVRADRQVIASGDAMAAAMPIGLPTKTRIQTPKASAAASHMDSDFSGPNSSSEDFSGPNSLGEDFSGQNPAGKSAEDTPVVDDEIVASLGACAGLPAERTDAAVAVRWLAAGASLQADIYPTITRLRQRQERRTGDAPASLAYYSAAVLDARDKRIGAIKSGLKHASDRPAPPPKRVFDPADPDHWRLFLGDPNSRFRGDYLSANWTIGSDNPHFRSRSLGGDPRVAVNDLIPLEIRLEYGGGWRWCRLADQEGNNKNMQHGKENE